MEINDAKHKAACLLKSRLEKNPRWQELQQQIGQTRSTLDGRNLVSGSSGSNPKARFMNLARTLQWAENVLDVLRQPPTVVSEQGSPEQLEEKLGWLREFEAEVAEWAESTGGERCSGVCESPGRLPWRYEELRTDCAPQEPPSSLCLAQELLAFAAKQARRKAGGVAFQEVQRCWNGALGDSSIWKKTITGWLHQSDNGVRSILAETVPRASRRQCGRPDQSSPAVVCRQSRYRSIWSPSTGLRRERNKRRVKTAHTFSSARFSPLVCYGIRKGGKGGSVCLDPHPGPLPGGERGTDSKGRWRRGRRDLALAPLRPLTPALSPAGRGRR